MKAIELAQEVGKKIITTTLDKDIVDNKEATKNCTAQQDVSKENKEDYKTTEPEDKTGSEIGKLNGEIKMEDKNGRD